MAARSEAVITVKGDDIGKAHRVLKSLVETCDGVWIFGPTQICLQLAGQTIARIEVTDANLWAEMVKDLVPRRQVAADGKAPAQSDGLGR